MTSSRAPPRPPSPCTRAAIVGRSLQRADYPADVAKLRRLLIALGDAKVVEDKTSDPANYPIIGVEDPTKPGAAGAEIDRVREGRKHRDRRQTDRRGHFRAPRRRDQELYRSNPAISVEAEPRSWIDTRLIDVPSSIDRERRIETGGRRGLRRTASSRKRTTSARTKCPRAARRWTEGSGAFGQHPERPHRRGCRAAKDIDFGQATQAIFTLSDGDVLTLTGTAVGDKRWIEVQSTKNAALEQKTAGRAFEIASIGMTRSFARWSSCWCRRIRNPGRPPKPPGARRRHAGQAIHAPGPVISGTSAGFGRRFAALLYDALLLAALLLVYTGIVVLYAAAGSTAADGGYGWYAYCAGELALIGGYYVAQLAAQRPDPGHARLALAGGRRLGPARDAAAGALALRMRVPRLGSGRARGALAVSRP